MGGCETREAREPRDDPDFTTVLQRYRVPTGRKGIIGQGTFSICYRGEDTITGKSVAVKMYKTDNHNAATCRRFAHQIHVLQQFEQRLEVPADRAFWHPCLAEVQPGEVFLRLVDFSQVFGGGAGPDEKCGKMVLVTELAEESLEDFLRKRRCARQGLTDDEVRSLAWDIVLAAAALHAKGFVHLDVKPANILLCGGRPKLCDAEGCVRLGSSISRRDASIAFSVLYCAPEWARFLTACAHGGIEAEASLDTWSVGLTLCELVTLESAQEPWLQRCRDGSSSSRPLAMWKQIGSMQEHPVPEQVRTFDPALFALLAHDLLAPSAARRRGLAQCLGDEYFAGASART